MSNLLAVYAAKIRGLAQFDHTDKTLKSFILLRLRRYHWHINNGIRNALGEKKRKSFMVAVGLPIFSQ